MPLLELGASGRSVASGVGRNGFELSRKPGDEVCELLLPSANLLQLLDQNAALLVGSIEEPNKGKHKTAPTIGGQGAGERRNFGQPDVRRHPSRREIPNQTGDLGISTPIS